MGVVVGGYDGFVMCFVGGRIRAVSLGGYPTGDLSPSSSLQSPSGHPATTSTERLELLDDTEHILGIKIVGGDHTFKNYSLILTIHPKLTEGRSETIRHREGHHGLKQLELGKDHKELGVELKKMAPVNGRNCSYYYSTVWMSCWKIRGWRLRGIG
ncbi:hypothetical protein M8C21_033402 [Ambrosia artemisiifolia]|uniref:Uncharacterized protein n=1 Tax=Ambrosia artemisiifolia TaxID=4212 RepID=A0AAD5GYG0_AMBAR|nr:hypothetical protein M8C21_033402 [Ambrosia artemisiifolia]